MYTGRAASLWSREELFSFYLLFVKGASKGKKQFSLPRRWLLVAVIAFSEAANGTRSCSWLMGESPIGVDILILFLFGIEWDFSKMKGFLTEYLKAFDREVPLFSLLHRVFEQL